MFRLALRLTVELEAQGRVAAGTGEFRLDRLVAGDAGVGAVVEIAEFAHAGRDTVGVGEVGARVRAEPRIGWAVTAGAGHTLGDVGVCRAERGRHRLHGRMTRGASRAGGGVRDFQGLRHPCGARRGEGGIGPRVDVVLRPEHHLAALLVCAAMAAAVGAGARAHDRAGSQQRVGARVLRENVGRAKREDQAMEEDTRDMARRLMSCRGGGLSLHTGICPCLIGFVKSSRGVLTENHAGVSWLRNILLSHDC
jgi:hypothetical protein